MKILIKIFLFFVGLRYHITIKNLPYISPNHNYLFLPNHISHLEPMILRALLYPHLRLRPVATSKFVKNKYIGRAFCKLEAISIEDHETSEAQDAIQTKLSSALSEIQAALQKGDSLLLYPSGQLAGQGLEYLGWKKSAYQAVQTAPKQTKIITVKIKGLRGSIWSKARHGESPHFWIAILKAIWYFFANGFFFAPKRTISFEFSDQTEELKNLAHHNDLKTFNQTLEAFYNQDGEEAVSYIPHYFWLNDTKNKQLPSHIHNSLASLQQTKNYDTKAFKPEIIQSITELIQTIKNDSSLIPELSQHLIMDLYLDSLDMAELKNSILAQFPKASNTPILELKTVADLVAMAMGISNSQADDFKPCERNINIDKLERKLNAKENILQHFKKQWESDKKATQIYDQLFGLQTRSDIVLKSLLISSYLKSIEGKYIGIMLPSVASTSIVLLATYLAEKIPVMMNRTHPQSAFDHCVKFSKTKKILTSKTFFTKINIPRLENYEFIFLEDLLKDIPIQRKLTALIKSRYFPLPQHLDETAVILYTSGSEALPKAVPLTHANLISNLEWALQILNIEHDERLFCYLPPFHSFGFTVNTVLPLVAGLRSVNTPDPNDSLTVAKLIAHSQPTLLATTPTFLRNLLNIANPSQLSSLRYVITGGEKCSETIFEKAKNLIPNAIILEGYGITECSPIIAINTLELQKKQSVGKSIGNWEIKILDIETDIPKPPHQEGMVYFSAPSVFSGYQDKKLESPFLELDGKQRYRTGDLGYLDNDGYLYITGRKKRFLKLGGEMISLPFIEEILAAHYGNWESANLAIEGKEIENWIHITLFTVDLDLSTKEVNHYLKTQGVSSLIQIDSIKPIGVLPLLWSGKIDYKVLKTMIE